MKKEDLPLPQDELNRQNWRFEAAVQAGFRFGAAQRFSEGTADIELLRKLAKKHVAPALIERIVL